MSSKEVQEFKQITIDALVKVLDGVLDRRFINQLLASGELDYLKSLKREKGGKHSKTFITSEEEFRDEVIRHMFDNKTYARRIDKMIESGIVDPDKYREKQNKEEKKEKEFEYPSITESQREKAYWDKELVRQKALELQKELIQISEVEFIFETFTNYIKKQIEILPKRMSDQIFLKFGVDKNQVKLCLDEEIRVTLKDLQKDILEYKNKFTEKE